MDVTPELGQILSEQAEELTTPFGNSCRFKFFVCIVGDAANLNRVHVVIHMTFEVCHCRVDELDLIAADLLCRLAMNGIMVWKPGCLSVLATSSIRRASIRLWSIR